MEYIEQELGGRKYKALTDGSGNSILIGPPEGLVDDLGLPEPFATSLHNILYARGVLTHRDVMSNPRNLQGALQEAMTLDVQKLVEAYFKYSQEVQDEHK